VIFDTDVLIWFLRGDAQAADLIESQADRALSVVSYMELVQGARSPAEVTAIRRMIRDGRFRLLPITEVLSYRAVGLVENYTVGHGLKVADALVAATALEAGLTLATGNVRHFRAIPQIELRSFRHRPA
jgi:hypothetical protein